MPSKMVKVDSAASTVAVLMRNKKFRSAKLPLEG
jgi:hypothetical protein